MQMRKSNILILILAALLMSGCALKNRAMLGQIRDSCARKNAASCAEMGQVLFDGTYGVKDVKEAFQYSYLACKFGNNTGCRQMAKIALKVAEQNPNTTGE
jgi:TPR repeat protein